MRIPWKFEPWLLPHVSANQLVLFCDRPTILERWKIWNQKLKLKKNGNEIENGKWRWWMNVTSKTRKSDVDGEVANVVGSLHWEWEWISEIVWNENLDFKQVSQTSSHTQQNEWKSLCQLQLYSTSLFFFSLSFLFYFIFLLIISERKKKLYKKTSLKKTTKNWLFYNNYHIFFCQNGYFRFLILRVIGLSKKNSSMSQKLVGHR
jgi:hypothetical protein